MHIPKLSELIRDPHPVIAAFLDRIGDDPYGYWYPTEDEDADKAAVYKLFREMEKRFGADDLQGRMPPMRYQPVKGTPKEMLLRAYDAAVHGPIDIKDEKAFIARRASYGSTHPEVRDIGSTLFYGGFESHFDERSVLQGPLYAGDRVVMRSSAKVIGPALLGDDVLVNTNGVLVRTVVDSGSQVDDKADIKDSILGKNVYVMVGAVLKHRVGLNGESIRGTKRHKMGCVIGDGCVIGANAVLNPGTILLPGCRVPDGMVIPTGVYTQEDIDLRIKLSRPSTSSMVRR